MTYCHNTAGNVYLCEYGRKKIHTKENHKHCVLSKISATWELAETLIFSFFSATLQRRCKLADCMFSN
jgi:hypothetical protein